MNAKRYNKYLLLHESGELSPRNYKKLGRVLTQDREILAKQKQLNTLKQHWHSIAATTPMPKDSTIREILNKATIETQSHPPIFSFSAATRYMPLTQAVAAVTVIVICITGIFMRLQRPDKRSADIDNHVTVDNYDEDFYQVINDIDIHLMLLLDQLAEHDYLPDIEQDALALQLMLLEDS